MTGEEIETLVGRYVAAWNEPDPQRRRAHLAAAWDEHGAYADPLAQAAGRDELDALIAGFQRENPEAIFTIQGQIDYHHTYLRFTWKLRYPGGVEQQGMDFGEISPQGQLQRITGFF